MKLQAKELLQKYQSGLCTEEEMALVEAYYNQWKPVKLYNLSEEQLLEGLAKLDLSVNKMITAQPRIYRLWTKIASAAAVLMIVGIGVFFYSKTRNTTDGISFANGISPGSDKATLILSDGRKINLDQETNGEINNHEGIVIKKGSGQLVYDLSSLRDKDGAGLKAGEGMNTVQTPLGGQYEVILSDGTHVWLNAASSVSYPVAFNGKERNVKITGEAYFEVAKNKDKPFIVQSGNQTVQVLGTHFNINSYTDEAVVKTTLLEGSVKVNSAISGVVLTPGQQAQLTQDEHLSVLRINTDEVVSWKNGEFFFKDESFRTNMRKIARWYNVDIAYDLSAPLDLPLGGWVSRTKNISEVLKMMEATGNVHFKIEGRRITVTK